MFEVVRLKYDIKHKDELFNNLINEKVNLEKKMSIMEKENDTKILNFNEEKKNQEAYIENLLNQITDFEKNENNNKKYIEDLTHKMNLIDIQNDNFLLMQKSTVKREEVSPLPPKIIPKKREKLVQTDFSFLQDKLKEKIVNPLKKKPSFSLLDDSSFVSPELIPSERSIKKTQFRENQLKSLREFGLDIKVLMKNPIEKKIDIGVINFLKE